VKERNNKDERALVRVREEGRVIFKKGHNVLCSEKEKSDRRGRKKK